MLKPLLMLLLFLGPFSVWGQGVLETESIRQRLFDRIANRDSSGAVNPNILEGTLGRVTDSESVWVRIDDRREFRKWTYKLSKSSLSLPRQEVRVWLEYVSPDRSISQGKEYNDWFRKKAAYELGKAFYNRGVQVEYEYSDVTYRLTGMVWSGKESLNLWLVKNGWSFYLLGEEPPPEHGDFLAAEKEAQRAGLGLWKPELQKQ
jgi:hypothetical protein